ncbi:MAG: PD-(D/E)XK nuclease family protein [Alphaproteobacteria bacterium]|nr:PD-(D/E)XK nuclease family protein [Alphaproteobacteria bacterium]MCL2890181.1 PD-(D/E)XK nuclease family protein [Alphaproteobacteria bacterium]
MRAINNIFCASNPARLPDALWEFLSGRDFSNDIIFLPSRRAVRTVERMIVEKSGAILLPKLIALGEGADEDDIDAPTDTVSNFERTLVLAKMLSASMNSSVSAALPVARDLIRMTDYLENEGIDAADINWSDLVGEKYAVHFRDKARFLDLAARALPLVFAGRETSSQRRNKDIRGWIGHLKNKTSGKIIVCGSTGSVPATADLMAYVAGLDSGCIILPGKITSANHRLPITDPYYSEAQFLQRINAEPDDIKIINTGENTIDFLNHAFSNTSSNFELQTLNFTRIDCTRESEEAEVVAEITADAIAENKTVLIVTPDAAANQRIRESFARRNITADFSGGISGATSPLGRMILRILDASDEIYSAYKKTNLYGAVINIFEKSHSAKISLFDNEELVTIFDTIRELSDILQNNDLELTAADLRTIVADMLSSAQIRPPMIDNARISVLGTIESRLQTADIVILTGLNEGMFPAMGYENPWLPRRICDEIGLPPPERKVSLMALDFITLSCARTVYWTRSKSSDGTVTTESRFLSRVAVACRGACNPGSPHERSSSGVGASSTPLQNARERDNIPLNPLGYRAPTPPASRGDVWVTELELLIHNPYAFYAKNILGLRPKDDPWKQIGAKEFGILVHDVIESIVNSQQSTVNDIVAKLDAKAREILEPGSVLFHFWHNRFVEMAPEIKKLIDRTTGNSRTEIAGSVNIAGRNVRARADMILSDNTGDYVIDFKTGATPSKAQLDAGNMPQLPLEAYMLQRGGFATAPQTSNIVIQFLQLKNRDVRTIEYSGTDAQKMIDAAVQKTSELFGRYSTDFEPYEYRETSDGKYKAYDDLARIDD